MGIVSYIGAHAAPADEKRHRGGLLLAMSFFVGITGSLVVLGTAASYFGKFIVRWSASFAMATAVLSIVAGILALAGPALRRHVSNPNVKKRGTIGGAFVYGLFYALATLTTSAGPLMLLLTIAVAVGQPLYGAVLSLAYGVGRGLPFLVIGVFAGRIALWLTRLERGRRFAEVASGIALIVVGGYFALLARQIA